MSPWRQVAADTLSFASPLAVTITAALGLVTGSNVLFGIVWLFLVLLDFISAAIRVLLDDEERWNWKTAGRGVVKKFAFGLFVAVAGLFDMLFSVVPAFGESWAELTPWVKLTLSLLIVHDGASVLRNLRDSTGNWTIYRALMRAIDHMRAATRVDPVPSDELDKRWYDEEGGAP